MHTEAFNFLLPVISQLQKPIFRQLRIGKVHTHFGAVDVDHTTTASYFLLADLRCQRNFQFDKDLVLGFYSKSSRSSTKDNIQWLSSADSRHHCRNHSPRSEFTHILVLMKLIAPQHATGRSPMPRSGFQFDHAT